MNLSCWVGEAQESARDGGHGVLEVVDMGEVKIGIDIIRKGLVSNLQEMLDRSTNADCMLTVRGSVDQ